MTDDEVVCPDCDSPHHRRRPRGKADGCLLDACRVCSGCAHNGPCRGTVRCPTDGITRPCRHAAGASTH